uniref:SAP domain-containing protein n=1 Tax=Panagrolaimus sp. PS1159 TaxID=55785 RepID=A0AC35G7C1_9BILA
MPFIFFYTVCSKQLFYKTLFLGSMAETNGKLISELKVHELRSELIGRGMDGNGVKAALVARLEKVGKFIYISQKTLLFL